MLAVTLAMPNSVDPFASMMAAALFLVSAAIAARSMPLVFENWLNGTPETLAQDQATYQRHLSVVNQDLGDERSTTCDSPYSPKTYASIELAATPALAATAPRSRAESRKVPLPMT